MTTAIASTNGSVGPTASGNMSRTVTTTATSKNRSATQTGTHSLLATADVEPPYVLLGASFGGLLSYLYANTYPEEVIGMVLLDSPFPDELTLEPLVKPEDRYEAFHAEDEASLERISHFAS